MKRAHFVAFCAAVIVSSLAVAPSVWAQRTRCELLIPAMKLEQKTEAKQVNVRLLIEDLLSDKYHNFAEVKKSYTSFLGNFDGGSLDMTGEDTQENFQKWREKIRQYKYDSSMTSSSFNQKLEIVAESVVSAFNQCIHEEGSGLHVWIVVEPSDGSQFVLYANYMSNDDRHTDMPIKSDIKISAGVSCVANPNLSARQNLGRSIQSLGCTRTNASKSVSLQLVTKGAGSPTVTAKGQPACNTPPVVSKEACPYPSTGQVVVQISYCKDNIALNPPVKTQLPELTSCKPTACRNAPDIVQELSRGMLGAPLSVEEAKPLAVKLQDGATTVKGLMLDVASTNQFYERVVPKEIRDMPGQTLPPFAGNPPMPDGRSFADWGIDVVVRVRSWGMGMPPDPQDTLRWIALHNDDSTGSFSYIYSQARVIRHVRSLLAHPAFNSFVGISADNQIPPRLVGNRSLRYSADPAACPAEK